METLQVVLVSIYKMKIVILSIWNNSHHRAPLTPLEFFFQEQSYSSLHSGRSSALDHICGDIDDQCGAIADFCGVIADPCGVIADPCGVIADPCGVIADPCGVIADPCGVVAIPEAIGGRRSLRDLLNIIKHSKTS